MQTPVSLGHAACDKTIGAHITQSFNTKSLAQRSRHAESIANKRPAIYFNYNISQNVLMKLNIKFASMFYNWLNFKQTLDKTKQSINNKFFEVLKSNDKLISQWYIVIDLFRLIDL